MASLDKKSIQITDGALIPGKGEKAIFSAWRISFFGAIIILIILPIVSPDPYMRILEFLPDGILRTFQVTIFSIFFSTIVGLIAGLGRISRTTFINRIATIYIEVIRGIPLLVQLELALPELGVRLRKRRATVWAPVPEAAVDEDGDSASRVGDVGSSRCLLPVKTIARIACLTKQSPKFELRPRMLGAIAPHRAGYRL